MIFKQKVYSLACSLSSIILCGCGGTVPQIQEVWEAKIEGMQMEQRIKEKIYCEVKTAVVSASSIKVNRNGVDIDSLPDDWGVIATMYLQIDETGAVNPGVTWNQTFKPASIDFPNKVSVPVGQTFNFGAGATLSSQAQRIDKFTFYYAVKDLKKPITKEETACLGSKPGSSMLLQSDLRITEWLQGALLLLNDLPSSKVDAKSTSKQDVLSYEVKFIVITSGNVTPTWKLVNISANTSNAPLLSEGRTRTHDLLLTFGPGNQSSKKASGRSDTPTSLTSDSHLTSEFGLALQSGMSRLLVP